jgi:hypothetical protein
LLGINQFGLMIKVFGFLTSDRTADYMYGEAVPGLPTAQSSGYDLARRNGRPHSQRTGAHRQRN